MKDSFYFPHDYHARHDPKLEKLRMTMGCEGVGIYWCLVEMLYEEGGTLKLDDIEIHAKILNTTQENLARAIHDFDLFQKNSTHFYSNTLIKRLKHINAKRMKARISAKFSHSANAQRTHSERSAIKESKGKERKGKDTKENTVFTPPTLEEVTVYCLELNNGINPRVFIDHYQANGWIRGKTKIKDWKACVRTWENKNTKGSVNAQPRINPDNL